MVIKGILVSSLAPFENHMANNGEKLLGNASSIKRRPRWMCLYFGANATPCTIYSYGSS